MNGCCAFYHTPADDRAIMTFSKCGRRRPVVKPNGTPWAPTPRVANAPFKALARAFRRQ